MGAIEILIGAGAHGRVVTTANCQLLPEILLSNLDLRPEGIVDDPQVRDGNLFTLVNRVRASHTTPGARVFDIGAPVPFQRPNIDRVVQDTRAAIRLASDRRVAPLPAAGTGNTFVVELLGNRLRAFAGSIIAEDPPNDLGLVGVDRADALLSGVVCRWDIVAKGQAAAATTLQNAPE